MFYAGVLVGSVLGVTVCVAALLVHVLATDQPESMTQPALVPLHVERVTVVSLN